MLCSEFGNTEKFLIRIIWIVCVFKLSYFLLLVCDSSPHARYPPAVKMIRHFRTYILYYHNLEAIFFFLDNARAFFDSCNVYGLCGITLLLSLHPQTALKQIWNSKKINEWFWLSKQRFIFFHESSCDQGMFWLPVIMIDLSLISLTVIVMPGLS